MLRAVRSDDSFRKYDAALGGDLFLLSYQLRSLLAGESVRPADAKLTITAPRPILEKLKSVLEPHVIQREMKNGEFYAQGFEFKIAKRSIFSRIGRILRGRA